MKKLSETMVGMGMEGSDIRVGVDVSDKTSRWTAVDLSTGERVRGEMKTTKEGLRQCFEEVARCTVVLEAGMHSYWMQRELRQLGHRAAVVDPAILDQRLGKKRRRNDSKDADGLCDVAVDIDRPWVKTIWQRPEQCQRDLALMRARDAVVRSRAVNVTAARGLVKQFGERVSDCSVESFPKHARQELSRETLELLEPLLWTIEQLNAAVAEYDRRVHAYLARRPEASVLLTIPGVGEITVGFFLALIADARRFKHSRDVAAYIGLVAGLDQSGEHDPQLHITRAGDPLMRKVLLQAAHFIMSTRGQDSTLRRWALALAGDGKSRIRKRKAAVALARKLAVLLHRMWVTGEAFDPFRGLPETEQETTTEAVAA